MSMCDPEQKLDFSKDGGYVNQLFLTLNHDASLQAARKKQKKKSFSSKLPPRDKFSQSYGEKVNFIIN